MSRSSVAEDHWLPPDNFQEEPRHQVAHRTSPTNQGLLLVATLAAEDFGYLSLGSLVERLEKTFDTLDRLERHRGHFYNWYDTRTLQPLQPTYISTVDSGNLVGCLLTLKQGLREKTREPLLGAAVLSGLGDTLQVVREAWYNLGALAGTEVGRIRAEMGSGLKALEAGLHDAPADLPDWAKWLRDRKARAAALSAGVHVLVESGHPFAVELDLWMRRLTALFDQRERELAELAPWVGLLADPQAERIEATLTQAGVESAQRWPAAATETRGHLHPVRVRGQPKGSAGGPGCAGGEGGERRGRGRLVATGTRGGVALLGGASAGALPPADGASGGDGGRHGLSLPLQDRIGTCLLSATTWRRARLDSACYDLLASEARLASFLAIARGDVPRRHWFHLGRAVVRAGGRLCLVSWGGTMFEYLMPQLFLRRYPGTLLDESCEASVDEQIAYGHQRRVPWGISESAFSSQYVSFDYQYQTFGVPTLGLKRGLVWIWWSRLTRRRWPRSCARTRRCGTSVSWRPRGRPGSTAFTKPSITRASRLPENHRSLVVRCFMAHHQGMSLVALANCLLGGAWCAASTPSRWCARRSYCCRNACPASPRPVDTPDEEVVPRPVGQGGQDLLSRQLTTPNTPGPRTHLLSNGQLSGHAHQRRLRFQPLRRPGRDALARGLHARRLRPVLLRPRPAQRLVVVGGTSAGMPADQAL